MRLLWRHFANRVVVITNRTQLRFLGICNHERHLRCLDYDLTDIRFFMTFRQITFTRHAGAALTADFIRPSHMRVVFADPTKTLAVGAIRIHADLERLTGVAVGVRPDRHLSNLITVLVQYLDVALDRRGGNGERSVTMTATACCLCNRTVDQVTHLFQGHELAICEICVDACIDTLATKDVGWRERQIDYLLRLRNRKTLAAGGN
jgi:hypothetical protein